MGNSFEAEKPRPKFFKEKAERINLSEYDLVVQELVDKTGGIFRKIQPTEQLVDKESFGDIDLVCLSENEVNKKAFEEIFSDALKGYNKTSHVHSLLIALSSGKEVQVDFIQSRNNEDFARKIMYYSKGHFSSVVGMMAKKLHFKYGTDGFFKRFKDKRGNWHDILVSNNLQDGLSILGFNREGYNEVHSLDDTVSYVTQSPLFDTSYYKFDTLVRRDRESVRRNSREEYLVTKLGASGKTRKIEDEDEFFKKLYPDSYKKFQDEAERVNKEFYTPGAINGEIIMKSFGIPPGPNVGKILKFLIDNYPEATELSEEMILRGKKEVLGFQ